MLFLSLGSDIFPLLKTDNLNKEERETLIADLVDQSETIHRSFGVLVSNVERFLENSGITTSNIQNLYQASGSEEIAKCIKITDTISDIVRKVTRGKHWTFFNYELLKITVDAFCKSTHITDLLSQYIADFKEYCKRRLCEVPANALNINIPHSKSSQMFNVKLDEHSTMYVLNIKKVQIRLSKLLEIKIVNLVSVAKGCVELTFRIYKKIDIASKLTPTTTKELADINIMWLQCGTDRFSIRKTAPADTMEESTIIKGELL